jgi:hypothetical protein
VKVAWVTVVLALSIAACGATSNSDTGDASASGADGCGSSACEAATWPRLVVAVTPGAGVDAASGEVALHVTAMVNGALLDPMTGGCPNEFDVIDCQYNFYGAPGQTQMQLIVTGPGGTSMSDVPLRDFNYCGNDLAYVHVSEPSSAAPPVIGAPEYVSPCKMP